MPAQTTRAVVIPSILEMADAAVAWSPKTLPESFHGFSRSRFGFAAVDATSRIPSSPSVDSERRFAAFSRTQRRSRFLLCMYVARIGRPLAGEHEVETRDLTLTSSFETNQARGMKEGVTRVVWIVRKIELRRQLAAISSAHLYMNMSRSNFPARAISPRVNGVETIEPILCT